jgi:hypothetical protein
MEIIQSIQEQGRIVSEALARLNTLLATAPEKEASERRTEKGRSRHARESAKA